MKKTILFPFKSLFSLSLIVILVSSYSCTNKTGYLDQYLTQKEIQFEKISVNLGEAYWNFYSAEAEYDLKTQKNDFYKLLTNDTLNNLIASWYLKRSEIKDSLLRRRIEVWHNVLVSAKVEFDPEIMNLRNELEEKFEVSEEKNNSYYDYEGNILELIELRNKKAVELGYENYVHLTYDVTE